jgi:hypothetical protein
MEAIVLTITPRADIPVDEAGYSREKAVTNTMIFLDNIMTHVCRLLLQLV